MAAGPGPPDDISAEKLFRLLLRSPRALESVDIPLTGARRGAFSVRALTPLEDAAAIDAAATEEEPARGARLEEELVAACLYEGERRAFDSGASLAALVDELEFARLRAAVLPVLYRIAPSYRRSDTGAWFAKLCVGAAHAKNQALAVPLAQCIDGLYRGWLPRPERYFGLSVAELTDGHWLAFRAAHQVIVKAREHG